MEMSCIYLGTERGKIIRAAISKEPTYAKGLLLVTFRLYNNSRGGILILQMVKRLRNY